MKKKILSLCTAIVVLFIAIGLCVYLGVEKESPKKGNEQKSEKNDKNSLIEIPISAEETEKIKSEMVAITEDYVSTCGGGITSENRNDKRREYVDYLGSKGYTVCMDFYNGKLTNYEQFDSFCKSLENAFSSEDKVEVDNNVFDLFYIQVDGSLLKYHFDYEDGKIIFTASTSYIDSENNTVKAPFITRYELYTFDYTERGWLFIEQYVEESNEMNGHQAIRVKPFNGEYKDLCEKYVERIGYQCNNLFITEWTENDFSNINFNDLFEFLYYEKSGGELDHDAFYDGIPENEFYSLIKEYFNITDENLKSISKFNEENNTFIWARIGCLSYSPDISGEPFAEVVDKRDNDDGTFTLLINTKTQINH